jgi:hypothetical protein
VLDRSRDSLQKDWPVLVGAGRSALPGARRATRGGNRVVLGGAARREQPTRPPRVAARADAGAAAARAVRRLPFDNRRLFRMFRLWTIARLGPSLAFLPDRKEAFLQQAYRLFNNVLHILWASCFQWLDGFVWAIMRRGRSSEAAVSDCISAGQTPADAATHSDRQWTERRNDILDP